MRKKIAIFASGNGSDMQSVVDACDTGQINADVALLIVNKSEIGAIDRAVKHVIPYCVCKLSDYTDHSERDKVILNKLLEYKIDLVVLAGYLSVVTDVIVNAYQGRIINIHPSLIPRHCGKGYYGRKVHESVIASGDKESGATVHYVEVGVDTGKILAQIKVDVYDNDTPDTLQARVLKEEHIILPQVVADLCRDKE